MAPFSKSRPSHATALTFRSTLPISPFSRTDSMLLAQSSPLNQDVYGITSTASTRKPGSTDPACSVTVLSSDPGQSTVSSAVATDGALASLRSFGTMPSSGDTVTSAGAPLIEDEPGHSGHSAEAYLQPSRGRAEALVEGTTGAASDGANNWTSQTTHFSSGSLTGMGEIRLALAFSCTKVPDAHGRSESGGTSIGSEKSFPNTVASAVDPAGSTQSPTRSSVGKVDAHQQRRVSTNAALLLPNPAAESTLALDQISATGGLADNPGPFSTEAMDPVSGSNEDESGSTRDRTVAAGLDPEAQKPSHCEMVVVAASSLPGEKTSSAETGFSSRSEHSPEATSGDTSSYVAEVLTQNVAHAKLLQSGQGSQVRLNLATEDLGHVSLHANLTKGTLSAQITVENPDLRAAVSAHASHTVQRLIDDQKFRGSVEVTSSGHERSGKDQREPDRGGRATSPQVLAKGTALEHSRLPTSSEPIGMLPPCPPSQSSPDRLNVRI